MMQRFSRLSTALIAGALPAVAFGQTAPLPGFTVAQAVQAFGVREDISQASLSPDGARMGIVRAYGARGAALYIFDLSNADSQPKAIATTTGDPERLDWCRWAGNNRMLCQIYGMIMLDTGDISYVTRIVAIDAGGGNMQTVATPNRSGRAMGYDLSGGQILDWNTGAEGHVLMARAYQPEFSTGVRTARTTEGLGVDDIDSRTLKPRSVEFPRLSAVEYISDGQGSIRLLGLDDQLGKDGYQSTTVRYMYRRAAARDWQPFGSYDAASETGFNPYVVDPKLDIVYGLRKLDGRLAAYSRPLDGTDKETLIASRPDVDIDGFIQIGRSRRVVGVRYSTDKPQVDYFDPDIKRLAASLSKALPDLPLIRIVDSSEDERKLLVWAGSDNDPGRFYRLDRDSKAFVELVASRYPLMNKVLAKVRPIQVRVADGTMIPAYLTLPPGSNGKNLPAIVMPHGGPSARDEWGFDWLAQFWASIGYAVLQPNFRGSTGYGDAWFQNNGFQSWKVAIGDVADSGRWLVSEGIADPKRLAVMGWSYGGYAALQVAATHPDLYRAVIAVAPVSDLGRLKTEWEGFTNARIQRDFIGSGPHIVEGSPARQAAKIKVPVLLFHGTLDRNVSVQQARAMDSALRQAGGKSQLVLYDKLDHYLEDSTARQDMLAKAAAFLDQSFSSPP